MKKSAILYVGRNSEILNTVVRVINANERWFAIGAMDDQVVQDLFKENDFEVVLLGSGITEESEAVLRVFFHQENPKAVVVQHYGGGSGLLKSEIDFALAKYNKKRECSL